MGKRAGHARKEATVHTDGDSCVPVINSLDIAFVPGVTLSKWTRTWAERRPDVPLTVTQIGASEQVAVLHDGRAQLSFVRLPIDRSHLHVIPLYRERAVVVAPRDSAVASAETVTLADLSNDTLLADVENIDLVAAGGGVIIVPHSIARLHSRKDLVARIVTGAPETEIALAWRTELNSAPLVAVIDEFIGVVRGRTVRSSRAPEAATVASRKRGRGK